MAALPKGILVSKPIDRQFYKLIKAAVKEGLHLVEDLVKRGKLFERYEYCTMDNDEESEQGFPVFSSTFEKQGPNDYKSVFGDYKTAQIRIDNLKSVKDLLQYVASNSVIKGFYTDLDPKYGDVTVAIGIQNVVKEFVDRYIHLYNKFDMVNRLFFKIYVPVERYIYSRQLQCWIQQASATPRIKT